MKTATLFYSRHIKNSKVILRIDHWLVADYPISFTPKECLEEFCESVGWRFLSCYGNIGIRMLQFYQFQFERPIDEDITATIIDEYERRLVAEVVF